LRVTKIGKIKGFRIFRDFNWPSNLQNFGQFNLIYGWNRSGKTSLSLLFRHLQDRSAILEGEVEFEIDNRKVSGGDLATARLPAVRVFNRDIITSTILKAGGELSPIYYFGEDSVEKQKQVEKLKDELKEAEEEVAKARTGNSRVEEALDEFYIKKAKTIKELLISSQALRFANYDKRSFKQAIENLTKESADSALLADEHKEKLRKQKDAQPKAAVPEVALDVPDFDGLARDAEVFLQLSVASQVIEELVEDREIGAWVQKGLVLHTGDRNIDKCRFCGQTLTEARVHKLEAHFNDAFAKFQSAVAALAEQVESKRERLAKVPFPDQARLYEHLAGELQSATSEAWRLLEEASDFLKLLHEVLLRKHESPFERMPLESELQDLSRPDRAALISAMWAVNSVIKKHNATTKDFANKVQEAYETLEQCYVAEAFAEYCKLTGDVKVAELAMLGVINNPATLKTKIEAIEREIVKHQLPAKELNTELRSYLGHGELLLDVKDTGYVLTRGGQPASNLSESEKTAIAFLYFLKSLQDKAFDLENSVVVIDDPVSSLDANSLFSAFGYMKERTKGAGQLFVLTHNFSFFRQVKNWFYHLPDQRKKDPALRPGRFFLLKICFKEGQRIALLCPLDPLLEQYEAEYHYLFKQVYTEVQRRDVNVKLEEYYGMPNVARRLLEAFLSFRFPAIPDSQSKLHKSMEEVELDENKKTRILRFLNTFSHFGSVSEPEHDPSILSETRPVLNDVLELIEKCDPAHYNGMVSAIRKAEAENDDR
jgi:wobble nucleotide-excising tRNase